MNARKWLWTIALLAGVPAAACGDDDSAPADPPNDAGPDRILRDRVEPPEDAPSDVKPPEDGGARSARFVGLHNVFVTSAVRFCFAASATNANPGPADVLDIPPQPASAAGIAPGRFAAFTVPNIVGKHVRVYVFYVSALEGFALSQKTCGELMAASFFIARPQGDAGAGDAGEDGGDGGDNPPIDAGGKLLIEGVDFESAIDVTPSSVLDSTSKFLLHAVGCPRNYTTQFAGANACQGVDKAVGDMQGWAYKLDPTAAGAGKNRAQLVHGTPQIARRGLNRATGAVNYQDAAADATTSEPIVGPVDGGVVYLARSGPVTPAPGTELSALASATSASVSVGAGTPLTRAMPVVLDVSGLTTNDLVAGKSFTFIFSGTSAFGAPFFADGGANPAALQLRLVPNE